MAVATNMERSSPEIMLAYFPPEARFSCDFYPPFMVKAGRGPLFVIYLVVERHSIIVLQSPVLNRGSEKKQGKE